MQIVFINYGPYGAASGVHIHFLANEMTHMGHSCTVVVPHTKNREYFGRPDYEMITHNDFAARGAEGGYSARTVFHAWTPRENTRLLTTAVARAAGGRWFVHLEDNERAILENERQRPFSELVSLAARGLYEQPDGLSHPILHQTFIAEAAGVSLLMDTLAEFVPPDVPRQLIWPACEEAFFQIPPRGDTALRNELHLPGNAAVIVYPGNVHRSVAPIVAPLYRALPLIQAAGHPVRLIRCGGGDRPWEDEEVRHIADTMVNYYVVAARDLPRFTGLADVLVQPGGPGRFDDYRFPSKLPLMLASGRPVILPETNLGRWLTDGLNCRILPENTPESIAALVVELLEDRRQAYRLGVAGRAFAREHFDWKKTAETLLEFYTTCLGD